MTPGAISASRKDLDISLGQVCSLRDEALTSRMRLGPSFASCRRCAAWIASRAFSQSTASS